MDSNYYIYILRCDDGSLYTGITTDLERRFRQHSSEIRGGAKYTASKHPVKFEAVFRASDRSAASRLEYRIKKLKKSEKETLIQGGIPKGVDLSEYERV